MYLIKVNISKMVCLQFLFMCFEIAYMFIIKFQK